MNQHNQQPGSADLPIFCYAKQDHDGSYEFNTIDEFSCARTDGEPLVKLSDAIAASRRAAGGQLAKLPHWIDNLKGKDPMVDDLIEYILQLRQALTASLPDVVMPEKVTCGECKGTGYGVVNTYPEAKGCSDCNGKGYDWEPAEGSALVASDEQRAKMLRADLKVLQSFVDDLDESEAVKAFYNVRAAVIASFYEGSAIAAEGATQAGEHRNAVLEEAALICDQQAKEPECPERAAYCAEAIRALKRSK